MCKKERHRLNGKKKKKSGRKKAAEVGEIGVGTGAGVPVRVDCFSRREVRAGTRLAAPELQQSSSRFLALLFLREDCRVSKWPLPPKRRGTVVEHRSQLQTMILHDIRWEPKPFPNLH